LECLNEKGRLFNEFEDSLLLLYRDKGKHHV
jgi:hypothetical protein